VITNLYSAEISQENQENPGVLERGDRGQDKQTENNIKS